MTGPLELRPPAAADAAVWRRLWTEYLTFYRASVSEAVYASTFARILSDDLREPRCLLAFRDGEAVGLVHYVFQRNCWQIEDTCYLQDLYAVPEARGQGIGRRLIEAVYAAADAAGCPSVWWLTAEDNHTARALYDRIAVRTPFIEYNRR